MIDHIGIDVSSLEKSKNFYKTALAPLGITVLHEVSSEQTGSDAFVGMGSGGNPYFWFGEGDQTKGAVHVAFTASSRAEVDAFHKAALEAGGKDNGAPGLRSHYHEHYYGAFVFDPDGNNIEAVCHLPPEQR